MDSFVDEKGYGPKDKLPEHGLHQVITTGEGEIIENKDHLHRRLGNRQIQLIAIGGSIGTATFVTIGSGLEAAGPGSLLVAYTIYSVMLGLINNCLAEMTILYPVSGGFVRLAGHFVDESFGFMAGWNFFLFEGFLVPFEITALSTVLSYWSADIPGWSIPLACLILYAVINVFAVKWYGETEFWLSGGKVFLIMIVFSFTLVTMCGGNPRHDAYGFRYWNNPQDAFAEYRSTGNLGRFEGFLAALWSASFTVVGPEYISMVAAEAKRPTVYIKSAFKTVYFRFGFFFLGAALTVGIVCAHNDPQLVKVVSGGTGGGTASASPYVIAMTNLGITGLPHLVNALLVTSIFSAGNAYVFSATRTLYGLSLDGRAPKFLRYCTRSGIPIWCFLIVLIFPCLSFLQVSSGSLKVLKWLINIITAGQVISYVVMSVTYIFFYRACMAQGVDRSSFPYTGYMQPFCGYAGAVFMTLVVFFYGYSSFGPWDVESFFVYYALLILAPILFIFWKVVKRTKLIRPEEVDLVWERPTIEAYEASFLDPPTGFWREMLELVGIGRHSGRGDRRRSSVAQAM